MKEVFQMNLNSAMAEMWHLLGETVTVEMKGSKDDLTEITKAVSNPFIKEMTTDVDKIIVTFHTAEELCNQLQELNSYYKTEEYYREKPIKEGTIIDEEQSVRWNREEVVRRNKEIERKIIEDEHFHILVERAITEVIKEHANEVFPYQFNPKTLDLVYNSVYGAEHSYGYVEIGNRFIDAMQNIVDVCMIEGFIK